MCSWRCLIVFFFFNDTATTEIYTLSLHDALPISGPAAIAEIFPTKSRSTWMTSGYALAVAIFGGFAPFVSVWLIDRKSTRLNSSHANISYAVFCLKKKKLKIHIYLTYDQLLDVAI